LEDASVKNTIFSVSTEAEKIHVEVIDDMKDAIEGLSVNFLGIAVNHERRKKFVNFMFTTAWILIAIQYYISRKLHRWHLEDLR